MWWIRLETGSTKWMAQRAHSSPPTIPHVFKSKLQRPQRQFSEARSKHAGLLGNTPVAGGGNVECNKEGSWEEGRQSGWPWAHSPPSKIPRVWWEAGWLTISLKPIRKGEEGKGGPHLTPKPTPTNQPWTSQNSVGPYLPDLLTKSIHSFNLLSITTSRRTEIAWLGARWRGEPMHRSGGAGQGRAGESKKWAFCLKFCNGLFIHLLTMY